MIVLPWPAKELSPNARVHWAKKSKIAKVHRQIAGWETTVAGHKVIWDGKVHLYMTFCPPDNRRRDLDNLIASCKSFLDGVADALRLDDCRFVLHAEVGGVVKGGAVNIDVQKTARG